MRYVLTMFASMGTLCLFAGFAGGERLCGAMPLVLYLGIILAYAVFLRRKILHLLSNRPK